MGHHYTDF